MRIKLPGMRPEYRIANHCRKHSTLYIASFPVSYKTHHQHRYRSTLLAAWHCCLSWKRERRKQSDGTLLLNRLCLAVILSKLLALIIYFVHDIGIMILNPVAYLFFVCFYGPSHFVAIYQFYAVAIFLNKILRCCPVHYFCNSFSAKLYKTVVYKIVCSTF